MSGTRVLYVGVPLLQTMTRTEVLWVLGHEMGHYSERHTAMSGVTRRGLVALVEVVDGFGPRHVLGWLFAATSPSMRGSSTRSGAVRSSTPTVGGHLTGSGSGIAALRAMVVTSSTWSTYSREYASVGTSVGMVPRGVSRGTPVPVRPGAQRPGHRPADRAGAPLALRHPPRHVEAHRAPAGAGQAADGPAGRRGGTAAPERSTQDDPGARGPPGEGGLAHPGLVGPGGRRRQSTPRGGASGRHHGSGRRPHLGRRGPQ